MSLNRRNEKQNRGNPLVLSDKIIEKLTLKEVILHYPSSESVLDGSANDNLKSDLRSLKERIRQNVKFYDSVDLDELLCYIEDEVKVYDDKIEYAYNELPNQTTEEIDNYVWYLTYA